MKEDMKKISVDIPKKYWDIIVEEADKEELKPSDMVRKIFKIFAEG